MWPRNDVKLALLMMPNEWIKNVTNEIKIKIKVHSDNRQTNKELYSKQSDLDNRCSQTDRQTDEDRQKDRQPDRWNDNQKPDRQTDK